jgi:HlyD family secretion protein
VWRSARIRTALVAAVIFVVLASRLFYDSPKPLVGEAVVTIGPIVSQIVAAGMVQSISSTEVGSQVSGTIQALAADYNAVVRAGDVLARLDSSTYEAALDGAQAALTSARAEAAASQLSAQDAEVKLSRDEQMFARSLIAPADVDAARSAVATADATLNETLAKVADAEAALRDARVNISQTVIRAPIDGIVIARSIDVGQTVAATLQAPALFRIATDLTHMQVIAEVGESDIGGVHVGQSATFQVEAYPGDRFKGTVSQVRQQPITEAATAGQFAHHGDASASASGSVICYPTVIDVENTGEKLRPGMTATVTFERLRKDDAVRIPNSALKFTLQDALLNGHPRPVVAPLQPSFGGHAGEVWGYSSGLFTPVAVRTGLSDAQWTEEVSGPLRPGDVVVTNAVPDGATH